MSMTDRSRAIASLSRRLRWAVIVVTGGWVVSVAVLILMGRGEWELLSEAGQLADLSLSERLGLLALIAPVFGAYLAVVYQFERLLWLYQQGKILTLANVIRIRRLGRWMVLSAIFGLLYGALLAQLAALAGMWPDLETSLHLDLSTGRIDFSMLFAGIGTLIVGRVMSLASEASEDVALTV